MNNNFTSIKKRIEQILEPFLHQLQQAQSFLENNPEFLDNLKRYIENWPKFYKDDWLKMAGYGWFINWETPITVTKALSVSQDTLDQFMTRHLTDAWPNITERIIELYPERAHILLESFKLHQDENYIACIPLFMSQIDGICAQNLSVFLFSEHERRLEKTQELINDSRGDLLNVFLEIISTKTQFGASISSYSNNKKKIAPNRNGVLHGSRKHLDYGTRINSLKTFPF
ncbi:MAG: hypothetical protein IGQ88_11675 [Gloeomargaritaceae cyanobacterium C42_A2020_066]|nr:hypothetical protein [Gloeomargaritaceae cyanobacterium C42_A2020_066]